MASGRIFLKTFRASLFNEDLSYEPNFGQIDLARQYLKYNLNNLICGLQRCDGENYYFVWSILERVSGTKTFPENHGTSFGFRHYSVSLSEKALVFLLIKLKVPRKFARVESND
jgi:hypothetical protein